MTGPRDLEDALLGLALARFDAHASRAADHRWSRRDRAEALCEGCRVLLVASHAGLRPFDAGEDGR